MLMEKLKKKIETPLEEEIEGHRFRTFHTILALNEKKELAHNDWEKVHTVIIIMNIVRHLITSEILEIKGVLKAMRFYSVRLS
jgi:hypothetical protein